MSRKKKHIALTDSEIITLREGSKYHAKPEFRKKCQGLLLNYRGMDLKQVALHLEVNHNTVGNWVKSWESAGLVGLNRKPGQGSKPILSIRNSAHTQLLDKAVESHRQNVKAIQAELIKELDKPMSADTVKRFLKKTIIPGGASAGVRTRVRIK